MCVGLVYASVGLFAHPAPFSYLDVHIGTNGLNGRLVLHNADIAHELAFAPPDRLTDAAFVSERGSAITQLLVTRLQFFVDGRQVAWTSDQVRPVNSQDAVELIWRADLGGAPGKVTIAAHLFPYDPNHQTFVNVFEGSALVRQEVLDRGGTSFDFFSGTRQGLLAVFTTFTASGIHHIAIGPDHILFIVGLLLLGGSIPRLLAIVTAFTLGHSVTLALATLDILSPSPRLIEPAIALSIVFVGADNLITSSTGRDVRAWVALLFGLIHGFGFANVLRETGLPGSAIGVSLFSFNLGVEIGQAVIVLIVATLLSLVRQRNAVLARRIAMAGSVVVLLAGAFWFVERVFYAA
jgi:hypothetical protein